MTTFDEPPTLTLDRVVVAPPSPRAARALTLAATLACAACGLVYELALVALGSYLVGDAVHQASIVLSVFVFAMGIGALAAKRLQRSPVVAFAVIEGALALLGGASVLGLYAAFAWLDLYQPALIATALVLGALIGAEIPVLMAIVQRVRRQDAGDAVADLFAADYVGALVGGLAFPFLLLPAFGLVHGTIATGAANVVIAAGLCLGVFRRDLGSPRRRFLVATGLGAVLVVLGIVALVAGRFEVTARQALYDDPIVSAVRSPYQDVVLTESVSLAGTRDVRLFLDGDLQFSSVDEHRYHEALVHPAMAGPRRSVLLLGGGDGLAVREVLRYDDVERVVLVDLDPAVTRLARSDPRVRSLNGGAFDDPRVEVVHADAFRWLRDAGERFDVVVADLPDPDDAATAKLYSVELYGLVRANVLAPGGRLAVQAGSPWFAREAFWCIERTVAAAGFATTPYRAEVPSFGPWGFVLAVPQGEAGGPPDLRLATPPPPGLRSLDAAVVAAAGVIPPDAGPVDVAPSTLTRPTILDHVRSGWRHY